MASMVTNYKCPACTGPLHFVGSSGRLECEYCGSTFDVAQIEALQQKEEAKASAAFQKEEAKAQAQQAQARRQVGRAGIPRVSTPPGIRPRTGCAPITARAAARS